MSSRTFADRYRAMAGAVQSQAVEPQPADDWPIPAGGTLLSSDHGTVALFDRLYLGDEIELARELIERSSGEPAGLRVYVDTETTGLAGGTGTYAFLIGLGWFEPSGFRVRQYFMRHPGEEPALLAHVAREIELFDGLATFNGRTFDMPLIETRFRMHRRSFAAPLDHLDLLHPARSIWKHRLDSCSLGSLERAILGVVRESDAPGWLIPSIYFAYLRDRSTRDLGPVIEHNRADIVSLARLSGVVGAYLAGMELAGHPADRLAALLARLQRGDAGAASHILAGWSSDGVPAQLRLRALREAVACLKRAGEVERLVDPLTLALRDADLPIRLFAAGELAKYLEHVRRDYEGALVLSRRAAEAAMLARDRGALAAFNHRVSRLEGKVNRL